MLNGRRKNILRHTRKVGPNVASKEYSVNEVRPSSDAMNLIWR
jgi:hypothetical protein